MKGKIPYGKQTISNKDIAFVTKSIKSESLTQGEFIPLFEKEFAKYVDAKYAIAVSNGTAALHLCSLVLGVDINSKVITTPITFSASANCVRYCGGEIVFCDIVEETYLMDLDKLRKILLNHKKGTFHGIISVDFSGRPVNLEALREIADEFGLWIIQDSCHSPGGRFVDSKGEHQKCGNGKFADLSIFSFHPVKHITCGEGGMITTNNKTLYEKLLKLRTHGLTKSSNEFINKSDSIPGHTAILNKSGEYPGWYMEMQFLGFNYRLTDIQASLGISQLKRADYWLEKRKKIAKRYNNFFNKKKWIKSHSGFVDGHAYHLYVIEIENRNELYDYLKQKNIYTQVHYIPVHLMPYYKNLGFRVGDFPISEEYFKRCLSLPMYPTLKLDEQKFVIESIEEFFNNNQN